MSEPFEWKPEYDDILERIAATDQLDSEWPLVRDIVKYKIDQNISQYLLSPPPDYTAIVQAAALGLPRPLPMGGVKLPPFAPRIRLDGNPNEAPKHVLTVSEARDMKEAIFKQLDEFDAPPFTIQRVCELCLNPRKHYKYIGKYLRAVDKTLLVTSTWDAFPVAPPGTKHPTFAVGGITNSILSVPSTPLFSPIPFLHGDARRSHSRSPPPSPLALTALGAGGSLHTGIEGTEAKVIGLVDELDDPSPGHLSDHPQALTSTTTSADTAKPVYKSLEDRFTKAEDAATSTTPGSMEGAVVAEGATENGMAVDEEGSDDKENKAA